MENSGVRTDALKGYVDDGRQSTDLMVRASRFNPERNRFTWREDWERTDDEENLQEEARMGQICLEVMNSVY